MRLVNPFEDAEFLQQVKTVEEKIPVVSDEYRIFYEGHEFWTWKHDKDYYLWTVDPEEPNAIRFHEWGWYAQRHGETGKVNLYRFETYTNVWHREPKMIHFWSESYVHSKSVMGDGFYSTNDHWNGYRREYTGQLEIDSEIKFLSEYHYGGWFDFIRGKMEAGE